MASFFWSNENNEFRRHEFQIVIDTLSFAHNLPLRVLDCAALEQLSAARLWYLCDKNTEGTEKLDFNNVQLNREAEQKLITFCAEVKAVFEGGTRTSDNDPPALTYLSRDNDKLDTLNNHIFAIEKKLWLSRPSNPMPIHILFRLSEEWRWFNLVWLFVEIRSRLKSDEFTEKAFYIKQLEVHFKEVALQENKKYFLIVGSIYNNNMIKTADDFEQSVTDIINTFSSFFSHYCKRSLTHRFEKETLYRLTYFRFYLSSAELNARIEQSVNALKSLSTTFRLPENTELSLNNYQDYYTIASIYIGIHTSVKTLWWIQTEQQAKEKESLPLKLTFHLPRRTGKDKVHLIFDIAIIDEKTVVFNPITYCQNLANCSEKDYCNNSIDSKFEWMLLGLNSSKPNIQKIIIDAGSALEEEINRSFERLHERINTRFRNMQVLRSNMLNSWLQKHYAGLRAEQDSSFNKRIYYYICYTLLDEFRADGALLCQFQYSENKIKILAGAYSTKDLRAEHTESIIAIENISQADKKIYAIYEAITSGEIKTEKSDAFCQCGKSFIIVPIKFQGCVYGALKIIGLKSYQFQSMHRYVLHNIANILAEYFYNQQMISSLQHITQNALRHSTIYYENFDEAIRLGKGIYTDICGNLSDIFLANNVRLWLRDPNNYRHYVSVDGAEKYEFSELKEHNYPKISSELFRFYATKKVHFISFVFDENSAQSYFSPDEGCYHIGDDYFDDTKSCYQARITTKETYKTGLAFIITKENNSQQNIAANILGYICLYSRNVDDYSQNWRNIIELVSKQLVIVFEALETFGNFRDTETALIHHEIKQDAWVLAEITRKLQDTLQYFWKRQLTEEERALQDILEKRMKNLMDVSERLDRKIALREASKKISLSKLFGPDCIDFNEKDMPTDLHTIVFDIYQSKRKGFADKGIRVYIKVTKDSTLKMNRNMLYTLIQNLLDNMQKYSLKNTVVTIALRKWNNKYSLYLHNTAPALTYDERNFDPFAFGSRSSLSREQDGRGDGIGLYVVKVICDLYGIKCDFKHAAQGQTGKLEYFKFNFEIPNDLFEIN